MKSRNEYILESFVELQARIKEHFPFNLDEPAVEEADFLEKLEQLLHDLQKSASSSLFDGQELLSRAIRCYPNLTPLFRRELFWFVGGECLHFLGDEEIALFQRLEDRLYELDQQGVDCDISSEIKALRQEFISSDTIQ